MEPIRTVLEEMVGRLTKPELLRDVLRIRWRQIVGEHLSKVSQVRTVKDGVVTIVATSPTVANELQFRKDELSRRIRELVRFGPYDIRIRLGTITQEKSPPQKRLEKEIERIVLSQREKTVIEKTIEPIKDPQLRYQVASVLTQFFKVSQWKRRHGFKECPRCKALYRGPRSTCPVCRVELRLYSQA
ncbi:MAG: DUF721 domain-containing protein [Armatimonadetes bacterium]|nr:DUF721 domain-containing protein [Armatimonadota bacterium]MDW8121312.1 DUF721 domain-containing protein [Armatimonadota bacterium]